MAAVSPAGPEPMIVTLRSMPPPERPDPGALCYLNSRPVDLLGVHQPRLDDLQLAALPGRAVEAAPVTVVAGGALLAHLYQQAVLIAVRPHLHHVLEVPGRLALHPELPAAAAPVGDAAGRHGAVHGLAVHEPDH